MRTQTPGCDANQDGVVDIADVAAIELMLAGYANSYDAIGNITAIAGRSYSYKTGGSTKPHAVTSITNPSATYTYDNNGNMNVGSARTTCRERVRGQALGRGEQADLDYQRQRDN